MTVNLAPVRRIQAEAEAEASETRCGLAATAAPPTIPCGRVVRSRLSLLNVLGHALRRRSRRSSRVGAADSRARSCEARSGERGRRVASRWSSHALPLAEPVDRVCGCATGRGLIYTAFPNSPRSCSVWLAWPANRATVHPPRTVRKRLVGRCAASSSSPSDRASRRSLLSRARVHAGLQGRNSDARSARPPPHAPNLPRWLRAGRRRLDHAGGCAR